MQDYIMRQPILNIKAKVCAYRFLLGQNVQNGLTRETIGTPTPYPDLAELTALLANEKPAYIDYFDGLERLDAFWQDQTTRGSVTVAFRKPCVPDMDVCALLKAKGCKLAFDISFFTCGSPETGLADVMIVEYPSVSLAYQSSLIKAYKNRILLLAEKIDTHGDFRTAKGMGYDLFQGFFFAQPTDSLIQKEIKSLDISLVAVLQELEKPEPDFKSISDVIEHDLGLSYKLLRLVNSAYMAPKYKIRSTSQALTYLGMRELHQWISMLIFNGIKVEGNSELVTLSLVRGKMAALISQELQLGEKGSEPFFTGLFSLLNVILNREMEDVLAGLPLSDEVKSALLGGNNFLAEMLEFITCYEQASWQTAKGNALLNSILPERIVSIYLEALTWSKLLDSST